MNDQPIYVTFEFKGNLQEEVAKMTLGIKGLSDESQKTYKRLLADSNETFNAMSAGNKRLAVSIQEDINSLRQLDAVEKEVNASFEKGAITTEAYVQAKSRLAMQEAEIKAGLTRNMQALNDEMEAQRKATGAITEKEAVLQKLIEKYRNLSAVQRKSEEGEKLLSDIKSLKSELEGLDSKFTKATSTSQGFLSSIESIPGPLGAAASGIKSMTKAALTFIATPLGMVLAAIAAALAAATSWFSRTEEGENALAVASAAFGQVLNSLLDIVDRVGEWLYKAFTEPKEALSDLGEFIKGQFINRLTAVSKMGSAIVKIFSQDWKQGFNDFSNALLQLQTGVEDAGYKTAAFFEDVKKKAKENADLAKRNNALIAQQRTFTIKRSELEAEISRLRGDAYDMNIPEKQRVIALKKALELTDQIYDKEVAFAKEKKAIITTENSLSHSNRDALMAEAEAEAKVNNLEAERFRHKREMMSQIKSLSHHIAREESKTAVDLLKKELEKKKEMYALYYRQVKELGREKAGQAYSVLLKEGDTYLTYLQNQINKLKKKENRSGDENNILSFLYMEKDQVTGKKSSADLLKEEIGKLKSAYEDNIPRLKEELLKMKEGLMKDTSEEGVKNTSIVNEALAGADADADKYFKNLLNTYQTGFQKMATLEKSYRQDVAFLRSRIDEKSSKEEKKRIEDAIKARMEAYRKAVLQESDLYIKLFDDLEKQSTTALEKLLRDAKKQDLTGLSPKDVKVFREAIQKLEEEIRKRNPFKQMKSDFVDLISAIKKGENTEGYLKNLFSSFEASKKYLEEFGNSLGQIFGDKVQYAIDQALKLGESIVNIGSGLTKMMGGNILGGLQSLASGIASIFMMGKKVKEMNRQAREENQKFYDNAIRGEEEYQMLLRERLRVTQQLGEATLPYDQRITEELSRQQTANKREYDRLLKELQGESYIAGKGYKHGTWFRKAKTWNIYESMAGKSYEDIEKLYTEGRLEDKVKALFEQLKKLKEEGVDINEMLAEQAESMRDAYTGTNTESIADSILRGFAEGRRGAKDFADDFQEMLNEAVLQGIKLRVLEEPLRRWYESFAAASESGLNADKIASLREQYNKIIADAARELENMEQITGSVIGDVNRTATAKGIQSISQDSADELIGIGNSSLFYLEKINTGVTNINSGLAKSLGKLTEIAQNTSYCKYLETIGRDMEEVRAGIERMNDKGLRMSH